MTVAVIISYFCAFCVFCGFFINGFFVFVFVIVFVFVLNDSAASEVEFCRERYAVHRLLGLVVKGDFIVGGDDAGEKLAIDVDPCVLRHQELMHIPCKP